MPSTASSSGASAGDEQNLTPTRTTRATIKPGAIGRLMADGLDELVKEICKAFAAQPDVDVRWVYRYRESVSVYDQGELQPRDQWRRRVVVTRELEVASLENLFEWLRSNRGLDAVDHLEVHLSDGVRAVRLEMGSSYNMQSQKVVVETTEPEDDPRLARAVVKAFNPIHDRVGKKVWRAVWVWMWLPALVVYLIVIAIDGAIKDNPPSNGTSKTDVIVALGIGGVIAFLVASRYAIKRVRRKAAFSVVSSKPIPGSARPLQERATLAVRSFWQTLGEDGVHIRIGALVGIVGLLVAIVGLLVTILLAR